jgi:hypothetical protein
MAMAKANFTYYYDNKTGGPGPGNDPRGTMYEGDVVEVNGEQKPHGKGKKTFPDGSTFEGNFVDGKPHGEGKMTSSDGSTREGVWKTRWLQISSVTLKNGKGKYICKVIGCGKLPRPGLEGLCTRHHEIRGVLYKGEEAGASTEILSTELKKQRAQNSEMVEVIAERDKVISEKDKVIAMKDEELASVKSALHKEREIAERDEEIALLKAKLESMAQVTSGEESPDQEEEKEEEDDDEEENPEAKRQRTESGRSRNRNATNNRASRSRARMVPVKQENIRAGIIKCPDPQCNKIILHNGGCKILTCTNHRPHYLYFCAHCKKVGEEGSEIIRCDCPNRNTQADRDFAQEMRNEHSEKHPIEVE